MEININDIQATTQQVSKLLGEFYDKHRNAHDNICNIILPSDQDSRYIGENYSLESYLTILNLLVYKKMMKIETWQTAMSGKWTSGNRYDVTRALANPDDSRTFRSTVFLVTNYIKGIVDNSKKHYEGLERDEILEQVMQKNLGIECTVLTKNNKYIFFINAVNSELARMSYITLNNVKHYAAVYAYFRTITLEPDPVDPHIIDFVKALTNGNYEAFEEVLLKLYEPLLKEVKQRPKAQQKSELAKIFLANNDHVKAQTEREIQTLQNSMKDLVERMAYKAKEIREKEATLRGLIMNEQEAEADAQGFELEKYLENNKSVKKFKVVERNNRAALYITVSTPVIHYDEKLVKRLLERGAYPALDWLFELITQQPKYKLVCKSTVSIQPTEFRAYIPEGHGNELIMDDQGFANPHLTGYQCFGGNQSAISKSLAEGNILGAINQAIAAVGNINYSDGTVINYMHNKIKLVNRNDVIFYDVKTKRYLTYREIREQEDVTNESNAV